MICSWIAGNFLEEKSRQREDLQLHCGSGGILHHWRSITLMDGFLELAARSLATAYVAYTAVLGLTSFFGVHLIALVILVTLSVRRGNAASGIFSAGDRSFVLQLVYGFLNPLVYLLVLNQPGAMLKWDALDPWLTAVAWTLFLAFWGARMLVPSTLERQPAVRAMLGRVCVLGLTCLAAFALRDLTRMWWPSLDSYMGRIRSDVMNLWYLVALAPLYLIPALILNGHRLRLARDRSSVSFLWLSGRTTKPLAIALATIVVLLVGASIVRTSDGAARQRVDASASAIRAAAEQYDIDPALLAALVYVGARDVGPFRDHMERFATSAFLFDSDSHLMLARSFDLSIGAAQIKPVTALTALTLCRDSGHAWDIWGKHLRDVPDLGSAWATRPSRRSVCHPPMAEARISKPEVVAALRRDESNVAMAALILALYQWQWREANAAWDISERPEILATLYQIGFLKSRPHGAPRSNEFGQRVAEISREPWIQERFDRSRTAMRVSSKP